MAELDEKDKGSSLSRHKIQWKKRNNKIITKNAWRKQGQTMIYV